MTTAKSPEKPQPRNTEHLSRTERVKKAQGLSVSKATGPRTPAGKHRSRHNAVKHAIFTEGVLSDRESEHQYRALVNELAESLQPVGKLEEVLVEKLAMLMWRYRRLLRAEAAEIGSAIHALENREQNARMLAAAKGGLGLMTHALVTRDAVTLLLIVDRLKELRDTIQREGLDWERDQDTLGLLFGPNLESESCATFVKKYRESAANQEPDGQSASGESRQLILELLEKQLAIHEELVNSFVGHSSQGSELLRTAAFVPHPHVGDRLQRYEASLERSFDRTLSQLERLQRMRLGQPVAPPIKVNFSA